MAEPPAAPVPPVMSAPAGRNPIWSRDETILLLDLYLRVGDAGRRHPEVTALSQLLSAWPAPGAAPRHSNYRNPTGVSRKLRYMAQNDPAFAESGRRVLTNGNHWDSEVWTALAHDLPALAREVERIRGGLRLGSNPSRGPVPSFGSATVEREDGVTVVYVLTLDGATTAFLPGLARAPELSVLKFGRTSDLCRRLDELNLGFPPGATVRWLARSSITCPDGEAAHKVEQRLLAEAAARGWTIGGEFALAVTEEAVALLQELAAKEQRAYQPFADVEGPRPSARSS